MLRARFEAWTLPTDATFRKILDVPALAGSSGSRELSNYSDNTAMVSADWAGRDRVGSALMRRFIGSKVTDEWIVRRINKAIQRPGTYEISGPQINGIMEGLVVYSRTEHANVQDWIWDGDNILPSLKLADLGHINETYELVLLGERYELDLSLATTGDFLLQFDGNDTAPISFEPSVSQLKSAVEGLPGITEVSVLQPDEDTRVFLLIFEAPKDLPSDLTADFTGTGGAGTLGKLNDGFDPGTDTFTVTVDGDTTEPLATNISASGLEGVSETLTPPGSGLQGLITVNDVTVQGAGKASDPFVFIFHNPPAVGAVSVTFPAGSFDLTQTQEGLFDPSPITQSQFPDQRFDERLHGKYGEPPIEVITDPAFLNGDFPDSEWTLLVRAEGQFAGSQLLNGVEPHQTYQTAIPVRTTVDGRYRLVIRDVSENLIKWTSPTEVPIAADGQYHWLEVPDVTMPAGTSIANMRIAVVSADESEIADFYVDWQHAQFIEGRPAATWTEIVRILVQHGQARGAFGFLDLDFTDTHDSAGNELEPESFTAFAFSNLDNVLDDGDAMGYKWRVVAKATPAGGKTHDLQIYYEGEAEDLTASSGGPTVQAGAVRDASVVSRTPEFTVAVGWGSEGIYVEVEDAALVSEFGRIEKVFDAEHLTSEESLTRLLEEKLREQATNADALSATVDDDAQQVPLVDYAEGSKIWWAFPDQDVSKVAKVVERVSWMEGLASSTYTLNGSEELSEYGAMARAVDHLLRQFKVRRRNRQKTTPTVQGGGGIPDVVVAANNTKFKEDADLVCDSLGQDQVTIQQAIGRLPDSGGWVHLLEGTYTISGPILLSDKDVRISGAGVTVTVIRIASEAAVVAVFSIGGNSINPKTFIIEDLTINGAGATVSSGLISAGFATATVSHLHRLSLANSSSRGIVNNRDGGRWYFDSVTVSGCAGDGVFLAETRVSAVNVRSRNNGGAGWRTAYAAAQQLINCDISSNTGDGIDNNGLFGAASELLVVNSVISNNGGNGINAVHAGIEEPGVFIGNRISGNGGRSISANSASVVMGNRIFGNGTDTPIPDQGNMIGGVWSSGEQVTETPDVITFATQPSVELTAGQGSFRFVAPRAGILVGVTAAVGDPAIGSDIIVDVNKNGETVFTTPANRPTVTDGQGNGMAATPDTIEISAGDWFTVDIDQVGSTFGGADLTVTLHVLWDLEESA